MKWNVPSWLAETRKKYSVQTMVLISGGRDRKLEMDCVVAAAQSLALVSVFSVSMLSGDEWAAVASSIVVVDMMTMQSWQCR